MSRQRYNSGKPVKGFYRISRILPHDTLATYLHNAVANKTVTDPRRLRPRFAIAGIAYDDNVKCKNKDPAIAEGPRDALCQLKSRQLPRNSAETTCTTSPEQIEVMKLEGYSGPMCNKHVHSTMTHSSRFHCPIGVMKY